MEFRNLRIETGAVTQVAINRPDALNALNREVLEELAHFLHDVRRGGTARVLIVTGVGDRAFVAGADIAAMARMSASEGLEFCQLGHRVMRTIEELPIPVLAAVNGFALGGGLELAMACDLVFASERARFGQPEVNLGLIPGFGGTQRLVTRIGPVRAAEMILSGEPIDAHQALAWGLINRVVAADELGTAVREFADKIAQKAPLALRQAKAALRAAAAIGEDAGLRIEQQAFGVAFASNDRIEGTQAFLEKRKPVWRGQ